MPASPLALSSSPTTSAAALAMRGNETHTAYVVMIGDLVYKAKKPVRTDFVDFSTVDKRRRACENEVRLNRRLSPDVYLGLSELTNPCESAPEPIVTMRRMPADRRLADIVTRGEDAAEELEVIAERIAGFHAEAERGEAVDRDATRDAVDARWRSNVAELSSYRHGALPEADLDEVGSRARQYLSGRNTLFDRRIRESRIVDGHGDLLADDIFCLPDGPRILDCLDFDDHLRHLDGVDDAACLAMDLEYLGREDLASRFFDRYCAAADDDPPVSLRRHYIAYRAFVRAKVACLRYTQGVDAALDDARAHCRLALGHLRAATVRLALIGGLPGTGKSTLARTVAERTGAIVLSSDHVRKELAGVDPYSSQSADFGQGLYRGSVTDHVYAELLRRARNHLAAGHSVIVDASWTDPVFRERAALVARCTHSDLVEIECTAPRGLSLRRIEQRVHDKSDATADIYDAMAGRTAPWSSATALDTTTALADNLGEAEALWHSTAGWRDHEG